MPRPEYKATVKSERLQRGVQIDDNLNISLWFNIDDPGLKAQLDEYYVANRNDWKKQPSLELQIKIGDQFHKVCSSTLYLNDGIAPSPAPAPPPIAPAPAPPPPPPPFGYDQDG